MRIAEGLRLTCCVGAVGSFGRDGFDFYALPLGRRLSASAPFARCKSAEVSRSAECSVVRPVAADQTLCASAIQGKSTVLDARVLLRGLRL